VTVLGVPVALAAITAAVAALYRFSVGAPVGARALVPGALASGIGVVLVTGGFSVYVAVSSKYTAVYGAFAGAVIGMLAIYLAVYVVLLGAVLNSQLGRTQLRAAEADSIPGD
jgi:membrane protein